MPLSQEPVTGPAGAFATPPDPAPAGSPGELVERLRRLKVWAGDPSYETIKDRVNAAWTAAGRPAGELARRSTVANCFQPGRRRFNTDLVVAVVHALHPDVGYVSQWRQALRVVGGEIEAVSRVRVQDTLPHDLPGFAGRSDELDRLRQAARTGDTVVLSAIEGMAGVGKTQLAVHAGHLLMRAKAFERVLFVNLRGFHPDPAQPPADPAAVLDGFLRLLGVPGNRIPHDLAALAAAYRDRLATIATLVILDNAATAEQVRPLLPAVPGCLTLVTSRHGLAELRPAVRLVVDVFARDEAVAFLHRAAPGATVGTDPQAAERIARRCGYLPLALSLVAGHIRNKPGWTLTDHADRLDERHRQQRLDTEVELALDLSYQRLSGAQRRLLRLAALHPGQDLDPYAAAALTGAGPDTARAWLDDLRADHLLQQTATGRYVFHDLVRAYAVSRAHDEDRPPERRAALTRLFDYYLATCAAAMDSLHPAEAARRPQVPPAGTPGPDLTDPDRALAWLEHERPTLVAVAAHTATHGWPGHTTRLAFTLIRYFSSGYHADTLTVYGHAHHAARLNDDPNAEAEALRSLGVAHLSLGRLSAAADHLERALAIFRRTGDPVGQGQSLKNLSTVAKQSGRYPAAIDHLGEALSIHLRAGDRIGEASTLNSLGVAMEQSGRYPEAIDYNQRALALAREMGNRTVVAYALNGLGETEVRSGRYEPARDHLDEALSLYRQLGNRSGQANVLDALGTLHVRLGRFDEATGYYQQALTMLRELGDRHVESWVLNGLGEAALAAGRAADALAHHTAAGAIAADIGIRSQQAGAHAGLGHAHLALGEVTRAREHLRKALTGYAELGLPEADRVRARLVELDATGVPSDA
jgi:tetratricopeptide (TPR) repeat protein